MVASNIQELAAAAAAALGKAGMGFVGALLGPGSAVGVASLLAAGVVGGLFLLEPAE